MGNPCIRIFDTIRVLDFRCLTGSLSLSRLNVAVAAPLACLSLSSSIGVLGGTTPARCLAVAAGGGRGGGQEEDG